MLSDKRISRTTDRLRLLRQHRRESSHIREFREFYRKLPDKQDIFYMFFTGGLVHWAAKTASYVPDDVNLVILGSALPKDEQEWLRDSLKRPFHHVDMLLNDKIAWAFLFDANEQNFGWLDVDCLVLDSNLFDEMVQISDNDVLNATWWYESGFGFPLAATYFQFVNVNALRKMRAAGFGVSPNCYAHRALDCAIQDKTYYSEVVTPRLRRQLLKIVPSGDDGQPLFAAEDYYYDTTVMHQIIARSLGFNAHQIRCLRRRYPGGTGLDYEDISDELIHVGGVSYGGALTESSQSSHPPEIMLRYLFADYVALNAATGLPPSYSQRKELVVGALAKFGLTPSGAEEAARQHLINERGLSPRAAQLAVAGA